jgi:hypothetical protein
MRHTPHVAPVALLLASLSLSQAQPSVARVGTMWRTSVLSWDNPATRLLEDIATETVSDAFEGVSESVVIVDRPLGRPRLARPDPIDAEAPALSARIGRSPPADSSRSISTESPARRLVFGCRVRRVEL